MNRANIHQGKDWFEILQTSRRSQTAVMKLGVGQASGIEPEAHESSDQVLLVIDGELSAEIEGKHYHISTGDVVLVSAGEKHRFVNDGPKPALTFNVYSPPEYTAGYL